MLIFSSAPAQVWLVVEPVDMRLGIDGLSARIQQSLGRLAQSAALASRQFCLACGLRAAVHLEPGAVAMADYQS